jgi:hypothetical protein
MKSTWEYRIYKKPHSASVLNYEIHYCHTYNEEIIINHPIGNGIFLKDHSVEGLQRQINQIQKAFDKKIIEE